MLKRAVGIPDTVSLIILVGANLFPLIGVFLLGWEGLQVALFYWWEMLIVGVFGLLKMLLVRTTIPHFQFLKFVWIPLFCYVYFIISGTTLGAFAIDLFWDLQNQGSVKDILPGGPNDGSSSMLRGFAMLVRHNWWTRPPGGEWALLSMALSHGLEFVVGYVSPGKYMVQEEKDDRATLGISALLKPVGW
jgi:hypothetical protein